MLDRVSRYPGRVRLVKVPGSDDLYDMTLADEPTVEGTPLNKQNLLQDSTAQLLGLWAETANIDKALAALATGAAGSGSGWFAQCDTPAAVETKDVSIPELKREPKAGDRITVLFNYGNTNASPVLRITYDGGSKTFSQKIGSYSGGYNSPGKLYVLDVSVGHSIDLVYTVAFTGYSYRPRWQTVNASLTLQPYWYRGTYTGDGTYGLENARDLTDGNLGHIVLGVVSDEQSNDFAILSNGNAKIFADGAWSNMYSFAHSIIGNSAATQMNKSGHSYTYGLLIALG